LWEKVSEKDGPKLGGGFTHISFLIFPFEMIQFDEHIFRMGGSTTNQQEMC